MSAWKLPATLADAFGVHGCRACEEAWLQSKEEKEGRDKASEALRLARDARRVIEEICGTPGKICGVTTIVEGRSEGDDIVAGEVRFPTLRRQQPDESGRYPAVADYVAPKGDYIGAFAVAVHTEDDVARLEAEGDSYGSLLVQTVSHRVAEAAAEWLHRHVRRELWGYAKDEPDMSLDELYEGKYSGIRPAMGYPSMPDQTLNLELDRLLSMGEIGITLTENGAMHPSASVSGLYISNPAARYFMLGSVGDDQLADYARRRAMPLERVRRLLNK